MSCFRVHSLSRRLLVCAFSACIGTAFDHESESNTVRDCQIGAYRFTDGEIIDIARSEGNAFRWRKLDGCNGVLHQKEDGLWSSTLGGEARADGQPGSFAGC